jgi:hypothetical protein
MAQIKFNMAKDFIALGDLAANFQNNTTKIIFKELTTAET